ncbi:MAG TPA: hypothetical protein VLM89_10985, partial [Phycisphaerae bacterium]|nr:hypothetical protein [Phycisphaerae bacterium]
MHGVSSVMGSFNNHPGYAAFLFTPSTAFGYISTQPTPRFGSEEVSGLFSLFSLSLLINTSRWTPRDGKQ